MSRSVISLPRSLKTSNLDWSSESSQGSFLPYSSRALYQLLRHSESHSSFYLEMLVLKKESWWQASKKHVVGFWFWKPILLCTPSSPATLVSRSWTSLCHSLVGLLNHFCCSSRIPIYNRNNSEGNECLLPIQWLTVTGAMEQCRLSWDT